MVIRFPRQGDFAISEDTRRMHRHELTVEQWEWLVLVLPPEKPGTGGHPLNIRERGDERTCGGDCRRRSDRADAGG